MSLDTQTHIYISYMSVYIIYIYIHIYINLCNCNLNKNTDHLYCDVKFLLDSFQLISPPLEESVNINYFA